MAKRLHGIDGVLHALADPTRRRVVERLASGAAATSELARPFEMSLPAFSAHLGVLEAAGLVTSTKAGRVRTYRLAPAALEVVDGWLTEQRRLWERLRTGLGHGTGSARRNGRDPVTARSPIGSETSAASRP